MNPQTVLEKYFAYYRNLAPERKKEFEQRVIHFISLKQFFPKGELPEITEEMQVMTAATAVQLTFGLKEIYFDHFKTVLIYPDEFYSHFTASKQEGEVNPEGVIVFSWKHLAYGNLFPEKGENIGLKVFAKALGIQNNTEGPELGVLQDFRLRQWKAIADKEYEYVKNSRTKLYQNRPLNTREDFFPVSVECFFQQPKLFKKEFLELYNALAGLLNQYP